MGKLSNTAIPKYYGEFRRQVMRGEIPVCETISMEMNRIDDLIRNPDIYYDEKAVEGWIKFCEGELTLTDGSDLNLLPTFKLWAEQVYGWYFFEERHMYVPGRRGNPGRYVTKTVKVRLTTKQYLIIARGASKSVYESCHQAFWVAADPTTTHQVTTAPTMKQAEEVMSTIRTAIVRARGDLFKFLTQGSLTNTSNKAARPKLVATKKGIENSLTGSLLEVRAMTIDKLQGLRSRINTVDEWLSGDIKEDVIGAIEQGASKNDDYLIVATSSEGTVRNGPGDSIKMELMEILKGEYPAPRTSIWYYRLDDVSEVSNPDLWVKANPNIGITVGYSVYQDDVQRAEKAPAARNDILAKRFGIPMEGLTYFFNYEETLLYKPQRTKGLPCSMGMDASQGDDFCAFTFLFPLQNGRIRVKTRSYITEKTLKKLQPSMRRKYEEFLKEGTLEVLDGTILDMNDVYNDLTRWIDEQDYQVMCFGYDRYNSDVFVDRWCRERGAYGVEIVIQGRQTESVPLGEIKNMAEEGILEHDEELMKFSMGNSIVIVDTNGNRKLMKARRDAKIDNVSAEMDAWVAMKLHHEMFD